MIPILLSLPFLSAAALALPLPSRMRFWIDLAGGLMVLAVACALLIVPPEAIPLLRHDRLGVFTAILVACAATASRPGPWPIQKHLILGGMLLAGLAADPLLTDAALALSAAAALEPHIRHGWHRVPLAAVGLGLLLFGSMLSAASLAAGLPPSALAAGLPPSPLAAGCALAGLASLAIAAPVLLPVLPFVALRYAGPELMAVGLVSVAGCGAGLLVFPSPKTYVPWMALGQTGLVAVTFAIGSPDATFAGLVLVILLVLSQAARALAASDGVARLVAEAGLAGLPPFGVFPGLALAIAAVARQGPWLLPPLLASLAALSWATIRLLPVPRIAASDRWSAAWLPLLAAAAIGWFMPAPVVLWLHALAMEGPG